MIPSPQRLSPARPVLAAMPAALGSHQAAQLDSILARPLFAPGRRPAAKPESEPAAPAALPRLAGVLVNGRSRSAIFAAAEGGRPVVAEVGAQVGAYTVQGIEAGQVTLAGPGGPRVLRPTFDMRPPANARDVRSPAVPPAAGPTPLTTALEVMPSLRGLPGFGAPIGVSSGTPSGVAR